jgi:phage terminase small subunit
LNATQAAIRAGYSPKTAQEQSSRLLSNVMVRAAVAEAKRARSKRTQIEADDVVRELAAIGFSRLTDVVSWQEGPWGTEVTVKPSDQIDGRAVASIKPVLVGKLRTGVEIKLHDKLGALTKLGEHLGMWKKAPDPADDADGLRVVIEKRGHA